MAEGAALWRVPARLDRFGATIGALRPGSCGPNSAMAAASGSASACEGEQPLQVVGHGDQVPLAADLVETSQQELPEAEGGLDDAEHWLGGVLAQGVQLSALLRLQPMRHRLERRWLVWRRRIRGDAR